VQHRRERCRDGVCGVSLRAAYCPIGRKIPFEIDPCSYFVLYIRLFFGHLTAIVNGWSFRSLYVMNGLPAIIRNHSATLSQSHRTLS